MSHSQLLRGALIFVAKWAIAGLAFAFVLVWIRPDLRQTNTSPPPAPQSERVQPQPPQAAAPTPTAAIRTYADAVAKSAPAVVNIYTKKIVAQRTRPPELDRFFDERFPAFRERIEASLGSGIIVDAQGHIVTNNHVIDDASDISLQLADGRIVDTVKIVGRDPETDLAVLQIALEKLPVMNLGRSDNLRVGDVVLAIGNPYGLSQSVTQGIVSATGRDQSTLADLANFGSYIQTDAAINLGNSGGALVNTDGELIGVNAAVLGQNAGIEGISFAIPVNLVRGVLEQILKFGHVRRGWLGVGSQDVTRQRATELGLPNRVGIELTEVDDGSPAALAGLKVGDVITQLNGVPVHSWRDAMNRVAALAPGKQLRIEARRGKEKIDVKVKVEERRTSN